MENDVWVISVLGREFGCFGKDDVTWGGAVTE